MSVVPGNGVRVVTVRSKKDMHDFVHLPEIIFREYAAYVPPLWIDEEKGYLAHHNPILSVSEFVLLLAVRDDGQPIGRIVAYVDRTYNAFYRSNLGFFGSFECMDDALAGHLLIQSAENWLKEKGASAIRGPINPVAENWGFVLDGYDQQPVYLSPWNPPYYHAFFTELDYVKAKDLLVYEADLMRNYRLPERYNGFPGKFASRFPNIKLRRLDLHHIKADAHAIWEISNLALADNWGFVPLDLSVMEDMLRKLKLIVDPDAVWIAEDNGRAVGFCLGFPDINIILKRIHGRLFPFGWVDLLFGVKKLRDYRLFGLAVHPDWQGKALDAMMYIHLYNNLARKKVRMEANYILEDNFRIKNALEKLGMQPIKTYRIYEKDIR